MFVQACALCFLKEKLLENKLFYAKNAKMAGKGCLHDTMFLNCGHLNQNEHDIKTSHIYLYKENKELQ